VDICSDRPTGLTESLFSQWELGKVRPSLRYRAAVSKAFAPDEIDFDAVDAGESMGLRLVTTYHDLIAAMERVARDARQFLVATGSRSRDRSYLEEIERAVAERPQLVHYRLLFGRPRHQVFKDHLLRLLEICDPSDRRATGVKRLYVGEVVDGEPERAICASEREGIVIIPSLVTAGNFDSGIVFSSHEHARSLVSRVQQLYPGTRKVETREAVYEFEVDGD
jgi:hypothetical protein